MQDNNDQTWQDKIKDYCQKFNISLFYLSDTLLDPKVIPMIRGKSFEYSVMEALEKLFEHHSEWTADKPFMNAQTGLHDIDVRVTNVPTQQTIGIECKLSAKGSFRTINGNAIIKVKCMRSRTLGASRVEALAPLYGVSPSQLLVHNDQYLPNNFDYVITSLANAFYETDSETGEYIWQPTQAGKDFLIRMGGDESNLKDFAFSKMYIAKSTSLTIGQLNGFSCTRRSCNNPTDCGFIPNYPIINFDTQTLRPTNGWFDLEDCLSLFTSEIAST